MTNAMKNIDTLIGPDTMNPHFRKFAALAPALLLATALASCGGGGGGGTPPPPPPAYQGVVSTVPTVTYTSHNLVISGSINDDVRGAAGFGKLAQNAALDNAALKHAAFLVDNGLVADTTYLTTEQTGGILGGHYEASNALSLANFTGASPQVRATNAGYTGTGTVTVTELMIFGAADGAACIAALENSVYHLIALVSPYVDMGISFNAGTGSGSACAIVLGVKNYLTLGQLPASPVVYPYNNQTGVAPTFYNQAEFPIPASDLDPVGHPVVVSLYTLSNPTLVDSD
ncbi:MAG: hypothetical protein Q8N51_04745, partial [Gammaproteobacteria bacterium]|nr:hypothetical protein [Gammaproteobacteria bacterium]